MNPPLKWAGGKRWLIPTLLPIWQPYSQARLVEPFCGGLGVGLSLKPNRALMNDTNRHLINFYQWMSKGLELTIPMKNDPELYYGHRDRFNTHIQSGTWNKAEPAQLFYYLNRTGYNGLCRFSRKEKFNVPFGKYERIQYRKDFSEYGPLFSKWKFIHSDFETLKIKEDDFIYADPPYDQTFTQYSKGGFSWADQVRTAEWLAKHAGPVVASNRATDRILKIYRKLGFLVKTLPAPRRINSTGDRTPSLEMLATRNIY